MHKTFTKIDHELKLLGKKRKWLADKVNESPQNVNNWRTRGVPLASIKVIASAIGVSREYLENDEIEVGDNIKGNTEPAHTKGGMIPVISWVQAGGCNEAIDLHSVGMADDYVPRINGGESVYGLRVRGNSMTAPEGVTPTFPEGYIIHVDPQQSANANDYVIAKLNGEDLVTFKQLKQGDKPYLLPLNPDHKPIYDEFRILGKVIGVSLKL